MAGAVKRTISLPRQLAAEVEEIARSEGKTLSGVVQDALREARARRLMAEFREIQGFWSAKARAKGILTERDLERLLRK
ncbi:MAG TPA: ribbon-helix-helix protein, CopG family [Usitatibacter sp.]|nr:ribbon-helix-helix protein, CopG family [Usitatibacter sp.]